jgi:hypothetical protein
VEKTKKHHLGQNAKITAALIADIAAAVKLDRCQFIRHIALVLGVLLQRPLSKNITLGFKVSQKVMAKFVPQFL